MGGASAEISFIPRGNTKIPDDYKVSLRLYGKNYTVYTHSFLCYGKKEAERRLLATLVQVRSCPEQFVNDHSCNQRSWVT